MRRADRTSVVLAIAIAGTIACKSKTPDPGAPAGSAGSGSGSAVTPDEPGPTPTWTLATAPVDVDCGGAALDVVKPEATKPTTDRPLDRQPGIAACQGLASVADVCGCLATSIDKWAADAITAPARCVPATTDGLTGAQVAAVEVSTDPTDSSKKFGGRAVVLVAQRGSTWSAVASIDSVADIDHSVTPKRSASLKIDHVDVEPGPAGTFYVFQSRSWTSEHSVGEMDVDGTAQITVCSVPRAPAARAFCYKPLLHGSWTFTHDDSSDKCTVATADFFAATISATSATVRLVGGKDPQGEAGRYTF
jgi:hypothetical protein